MDWNAIKTEYITTDTSYRKLAAKHSVSENAINSRGKKENWVEAKKQYNSKVVAKTLDYFEKEQAKKLTRINKITDKLLSKIERAVSELEITLLTNTKKTKTVEYNNKARPDKPTKEITEEKTEIIQTQSIIDRTGLKAIASALKDIKEIQVPKSEADIREQEARIAKLERDTKVPLDGENNSYGVVLLPLVEQTLEPPLEEE